MKSLSIYSRGFTLIEVVVVVSIFALIISSPAMINIGFMSRYNAASATQEIIDILFSAQSKAISGIEGKDYGIHVNESILTLFEGNTLSGSAKKEEYSVNALVSSSVNPIVFEYLTGNTTPVELNINHNGITKTLYINKEGFESH